MKYETLAPYFTFAVAGLKDGSLDVCLPFPSTLSFSLSLQPAPTYTSSFSLPTLSASAPFPPPRARYWQPNTHMCISTLRERDIDSRGRTVLWLYCKIPRIHGSESANTEDWFLHLHTTKNWFISLFFLHVSYVSYFLLCASPFLFSVLTEFLSLFHAIFFCALFDPRFESPRHTSFRRATVQPCLSLIVLMCLYTGSVLSGQGDIFWLTYNPVLFYMYSRHMPHSLKGFNAGLFRISSLCMSGKEASGR